MMLATKLLGRLYNKEFWASCQHIVVVSEPLVRVLRLVDGEERPAMGYLYEAMDKAKEAIITSMNRKATLYGPYVKVIDARWDKQLHSPSHAAGCFLNPSIYFRPSFTKQKEVTRGLLTTITRLVPEFDVQDKISGQLEEYKKSTGDFGMSLAIRQREKLNPVGAIWKLHFKTSKNLPFECLVSVVVQLDARGIGAFLNSYILKGGIGLNIKG